MVERDPLGGLDREERVVRWFAREGGAVLVVAWRGGGGDAGGVVLSLAGPRPRGMQQGAASKQAGKQVSAGRERGSEGTASNGGQTDTDTTTLAGWLAGWLALMH